MRSVCGCTPASSAATEMMYSALSSCRIGHSHSQMRARVLGQCARERLDRLARLAVELRRHRDLERHEQIAVPALRLRDSTTANAHGLAALCPGRHLHARAERGLCERDRHAHGQVAATPTEHRVRTDVHDDVEITGRTAVRARATASLHADALPVVDARGDAHLHVARSYLDPATTTRRALVGDDLTAAAALRAHLRHGEGTLVACDHADAAALRAALGRGSGLRTRAAARRAHGLRGEADGRRDALHRLEEVEVQLGLEVLTAPRPGGRVATAATPGSAPEQVAEEVAEPANVLEVDRLARAVRARATGVEAEAAATTEPAGAADAGRDHLTNVVVLLALRGVAEHVVGARHLLEALLRGRVPGVRVGVVLLRELAIGARDVLLGRVLRHAEDVVVVLLEPLPLGRHLALALPRDLDHRGTQDAPLEPVPGPHDVGDDGRAVGLVGRTRLLHHRLVLVRVELLTLRVDARETGALEHAEQLGVDELQALLHALVGLEVQQRELERVEHREQLLDEPLRRALDDLRLLARHPLAIVLEFGLHATCELEVLLALPSQFRVQRILRLVGVVRVAGLRTVVDGRGFLHARRLTLGAGFVAVAHHALCSSSTISASATSSSDGWLAPPAPGPPAPPAAPPAACCCWDAA